MLAAQTKCQMKASKLSFPVVLPIIKKEIDTLSITMYIFKPWLCQRTIAESVLYFLNKPRSPSCGRPWLEWEINQTSAIILWPNHGLSQIQHHWLVYVTSTQLCLVYITYTSQLILYLTHIQKERERERETPWRCLLSKRFFFIGSWSGTIYFLWQ